jgi:hypothetical protein
MAQFQLSSSLSHSLTQVAHKLQGFSHCRMLLSFGERNCWLTFDALFCTALRLRFPVTRTQFSAFRADSHLSAFNYRPDRRPKDLTTTYFTLQEKPSPKLFHHKPILYTCRFYITSSRPKGTSEIPENCLSKC